MAFGVLFQMKRSLFFGEPMTRRRFVGAASAGVLAIAPNTARAGESMTMNNAESMETAPRGGLYANLHDPMFRELPADAFAQRFPDSPAPKAGTQGQGTDAPPWPIPRSGHGAELYRCPLFVMGGEGALRVFDQNEAHEDRAVDFWRSFAAVITLRRGIGAAVVGGPMRGGGFRSAVHEPFSPDLTSARKHFSSFRKGFSSVFATNGRKSASALLRKSLIFLAGGNRQGSCFEEYQCVNRHFPSAQWFLAALR
jgi:hypothetical protein